MVKKGYHKLVTAVNISRFIQFWAAGAVYFLIAWGTTVGKTGLIDLIFFLGVGLGIVEIVIVQPLLAEINDIPSTAYLSQSIMTKVRKRLGCILKALLTVCLVMLTYLVLNVVGQALFSLPKDTPFILGEPILFGILYMLYARGLGKVQTKLKVRRSVVC